VAQQIVRCVGQVAEIDPAVVEEERPEDADADAATQPAEAPAAATTNAPTPATMGPAPKQPPK
jgi:hypothetical protein